MVSILGWLSLLSVLIIIALSGRFSHPLILLTINYAIFLFLWKRKKESFINSPGISVLIIGLFVRYALLPLSYYIFGGYILHTEDYFDEALFLMLYEQIVVFVTIFLTTPRNVWYNKQNKVAIANTKIVTYILCVLGMVASFSSTTLNTGYMILDTGDLNEFWEVELNAKSFTDQMLSIVWDISIFVLYISLVSECSKLYKTNKREIYVLISVILTLLLGFLTFINQKGVGIARWQTIVYTLAGVLFLFKLFNNQKQQQYVLRMVGIPLLIVILFVTAVKNGGYTSATGATFGEAMEHTLGPESMDAYLNGPDGISSAIKLKKESNLDITSLFNDMIHPIPIIHKYEDVSLSTAKRYNLSVGKLGYIVPLMGQSSIYFGYILAPLLSFITIILVRFFERKYVSSNNYFIYLYAFCSIWYAMGMVFFNFIIILNWTVSTIIPLYIVAKLISSRRQKQIV